MSPTLDGPVGFFLPSLQAGGAERVMLDLAGGLSRRGYDIHVVAGRAHGGLEGQVPAGLEIVDLEADRMRYALGKFALYLRSRRPACVLATLDHSAVLALLAARLAPGSTPVIVRVANTLSSKQSAAGSAGARATLLLARRLYPRADMVVTPSDGVAGDLKSFMRIAGDRVVVIPNPVVDERLFDMVLQPAAHPWFGAGLPPVVLGVGRLVPQKGFEVLIRSFRIVRSSMKCRLVILGEGPEREALTALCSELGIADDVDLPGFEPNPFSCMAGAGVFVLSSRFEGLPAVLIQALACGAPVVSTDCPSGPGEILEGGRFGRLVPVGDVDGMAEAIRQALADPGPMIPDAVWRRYSAGASIDGYESAISRVAGARVS